MGLACSLLRPWRLPGTRPGPAGAPPSESTPEVLEGTMHGLSSARPTLAAPQPGRREKRRTNAHHWLTTDPPPPQILPTPRTATRRAVGGRRRGATRVQ